MTITDVKKITNLQTNFMFLVDIPDVPVIGNLNFSVYTRETGIFGKTRAKTDFRFLNKQLSLPMGTSHEGEWTVTVVMDEGATLYNKFIKWFYYVDQIGNGTGTAKVDPKANAEIRLIGLDGVTVKSAYKLIGIYPLNVPSLEGLNQENTEGHMTFECTFGVDDVLHYVDGEWVDLNNSPLAPKGLSAPQNNA